MAPPKPDFPPKLNFGHWPSKFVVQGFLCFPQIDVS